MRLLILGAGYVGMALLKSPNHSFLPTTTTKKKLFSLPEGAMLIEGKEKEPLQKALEKTEGAIILAAPKEKSLDGYRSTYVEVAKSISSILKSRKKPFYLVFASSTCVYQKSPKAEILREAEAIYQGCANENISVCILRLGGIFGPGRELEKRAKMLSGRLLSGTGAEPTQHIHLSDIVSSILFCLDKRLQGVFDLVNEEHRSRKEFYTALCSFLRIPAPTFDSSKQLEYGSPKEITNIEIKKAGFIFSYPLCNVPS